MNSPNVKAAERSGVEKVEKNSASAVIIASSTKVSPNAMSIIGSSAGRSVTTLAAGPNVHAV
jgi:hypothetical protein